MLADVAQRNGRPVVFVNQVGGNDELIFDGGSCVISPNGEVHAAMPLFQTGISICDLPVGPGTPHAEVEDPEAVAQLERGLVMGIRDYFLKQNLPPGAVIGLSGGIDSAVTAHLAVEALQKVDETYRIALSLFYMKGLSYKEIAHTLEIPIGTVMSRLSRGKAQLKSALSAVA